MTQTARSATAVLEQAKPRWPELKAARDVACPGENPHTGAVCVLGQHVEHHRDAAGNSWPGVGSLARPGRLNQAPDPVHDPRD